MLNVCEEMYIWQRLPPYFQVVMLCPLNILFFCPVPLWELLSSVPDGSCTYWTSHGSTPYTGNYWPYFVCWVFGWLGKLNWLLKRVEEWQGHAKCDSILWIERKEGKGRKRKRQKTALFDSMVILMQKMPYLIVILFVFLFQVCKIQITS